MVVKKKECEYFCCEWINSGLHFQPSRLGFCCYGNENIGDHPTVIEDYFGECIDEYIIENINDIKQNFKDGKIPKCCKKCSYLIKKNWDGLEKEYFDKFMIGHSHNCNSKCIYCFTNDIDEITKKRTYDVFSVIDDLFESDYIKITNSSCVVFLGGEPTIFPDFEPLLFLLLKHDFPNIIIHSSGIQCSKAVLDGLKKGNIKIVISPDAGNETTYNKIKRVNCFKQVWQNIGKYVKNAKNPNLVGVKYIIIPGINDNKEEIDKWFKLIIKNNVKYIACDVEQNWFFSKKGKYPSEIFELIDYIEKKAETLSLKLEFYTEAAKMLKERISK